MKGVTVVGSGGAFDTDRTNSSFLIEMNDGSFILYDCGYNVFPKLKELGDDIIKRIQMILISHDDDDHNGSVKSLIYYRYFVLGLSSVLITHEKDIDEYDKMNKVMEDGEFRWESIVGVFSFEDIEFSRCFDILHDEKLIFKFPEGIHHTPVRGLVIFDENSKNLIAISGDTKANQNFEKEVFNFNFNNF